jgi:hypothetical protein
MADGPERNSDDILGKAGINCSEIAAIYWEKRD